MTIASAGCRPPDLLSDRDWDKLTNMILEGCVVPVIGPELLAVSSPQGELSLLYDTWGRTLALQSGMVLPRESAIPLLYYVTNQRSQEQAGNDLAYDIDDVVRRQPAPIPEALRKLAEISFPLYVTTTIDHQLKRALDEVRPGPEGAARQISFSPRGAKAHIDLPDDVYENSSPTVYHLFGATSPVDESFAKTEDDLIEFSWSLLDLQYAPERLYEYLRKKTVLLIGCLFPDWLGRFLIYAMHAGRHEALNVLYVGSQVEQGLEDYLKRRKAKTLRVAHAAAFVDELHRRWLAHKAQYVSHEKPAEHVSTRPIMKKGAVFLSYAREDKQVAARMKAQLEAADIDTWMDESDIEPGAEFQHVIRENIRDAAFFLAIISRSLNTPRPTGRFLWREWKWAADVNQDRREADCFLQPIAIDDTGPDAPFLEPPFRDATLSWTWLKGGVLPREFVSYLTQGVRRFRRGQ